LLRVVVAVGLGLGLLAVSSLAPAQSPVRIGLLGDLSWQPLRQGLRELGYVERWPGRAATSRGHFREAQAGRALGLMLQSVEVRRREELEGAFASMLRERPGALLMTGDPVHQVFVGRIIELAAKQRRPVMYQLKENVERGGLISYGPLRSDLMRRAAVYVDKILKGTSSLLLRADRVIE
jgi:hypothetical protein